MRTLVVGAGQVGPHVARLLADRGQDVTVATRSGSGPDDPRVPRVRLDVTDADALDRVLPDVDVLHLCVHASAYRESAWRAELPALERTVLAAAARHGVHAVLPESVYAFDTSRPVAADSRHAPRSGLGRVRAELLTARAASPARTTSVVASDFYGPGATMAHGGERVLAPAVEGRTVRPLGRVDLPHAWTYLPDLAAAMVAAADLPAAADRVVVAPAVHATQRELADAYARAAGRAGARVRAVPAWLLRAASPLSADVRALASMLYLFTEPLLVDEAAAGTLGLTATPLADAVAATVADRVARNAPSSTVPAP